MTTPRPSDSPELRAARLLLEVSRMSAERIERNAELRRAERPAPETMTHEERRRARNRDYDAVRRAKIERERAARFIEEIHALEREQADAVRAAADLV